MKDLDLQNTFKRADELTGPFDSRSEWKESVNIVGVKNSFVPLSPDAVAEKLVEGIQNKDIKEIKTDNNRPKEDEPKYDKKTGKYIDPLQEDLNHDGMIDEDDVRLQEQLERQEQKVTTQNNIADDIAMQNYMSDIKREVQYSQLNAGMYSSTMLTPSVEFANTSVTKNTDKLIETLSKHQNHNTQQEIAQVAQATNVALSSSYDKIMKTFDKAIEGTTDADHKQVFAMIDDLDERVYGLDAGEKEKIKDLWRKATPEERVDMLERSLKGDPNLGMNGVDDNEMKIMEKADDLLTEAKKYAKDNNLNPASCFAGTCAQVADFTMRANFVHVIDDKLREKGIEITSNRLNTDGPSLFTNNLDTNITNIAIIKQAANENEIAIKEITKKELAEIGINLQFDKNIHKDDETVSTKQEVKLQTRKSVAIE